MPSDSPPPPAPRLRRFVGPVHEFLEDGSEVTGISDRDLILRAVNASLRTDISVGRLAGEVAELTRLVRGARPPAPSIPEVAQALVDAVEEITDHGQQRPPDRRDSERVREIAEEALQDKRDRDELEAFRKRMTARRDAAKTIAVGVASPLVVELVKLLFTGHW